ncbi:J domain-containing protein [Neomegalonema perideroedes]|uniref:J domain-containing protein n=1 Tax=Neomegalonema perideroedes TaxID=217219 RepID=UPI000364C078|nr:J domain-containing protein [Neomegalonema perideroedes]
MRRSPFDFDISVAADKRRREAASNRRRLLDGGISAALAQRCAWPGCAEKGRYRAPIAPQAEDFHWFCLEHVRRYNASWDYYKGRSPEEIEAAQRAAAFWDRPTWRTTEDPKRYANHYGHADGEAWRRMGFRDPLEALGKKATKSPGAGAKAATRRNALPSTEIRALRVLNLRPEVSRPEIRARYKELVKSLHPDLNGGDRGEEAKLREVLWAWDQLRKSPHFPDLPPESRPESQPQSRPQSRPASPSEARGEPQNGAKPESRAAARG